MAHANAALTPKHRLRLARLIVEDGWSPARAAEFFNVSWRTADKWARRYRDEGVAGMNDRSSARHTQHAKTPEPLKRKIVHLRWKQRLGPVPIGAKLGMPASTVHAVLVRCRLNRLTHIDRVTGEPARRYERCRPGELLHVDVTKFGNIPDGGGWRFVGIEQGYAQPAAPPGTGPGPGTQALPAQGRHLLRAHRHRRLHPPGLRRVPRRRDRRDRGRGALPRGGLVRRTRRDRRTGAVGQRIGLQSPTCGATPASSSA